MYGVLRSSPLAKWDYMLKMLKKVEPRDVEEERSR